jgi:hypothetical protein
VRTQVDRDLTTVDYFDRLLGLIKNLGRHTGVLIEASANIVVKAESVQVSVVHPPPGGQGTAPPFIGQGGGNLHRVALFYLCVEVWRIAPWSRQLSWRILLLAGRHGASCAHPEAVSRVAAWRSPVRCPPT